MRGYILRFDFSYISTRTVPKISFVCLTCSFIKFRRKNIFIPKFIERQSNSSNSSEKINKFQLFHYSLLLCLISCH